MNRADVLALKADADRKCGTCEQRLNDCGPQGNKSIEDALRFHEGRSAAFAEVLVVSAHEGREQAMAQATLPDNMVERTLRDLVIGESAYVVPWMMLVGMDRKCWLLLSAHPHRQPHGTACMRVELRKDGWHVWKAANDYTPTAIGEGSDLPKRDRLAPVVELH